MSSHLFYSLNGNDTLLKACPSLQLLSPPENLIEPVPVTPLREMCLLHPSKSKFNTSSCLWSAGFEGTSDMKCMSWLGSAVKNPGVNLDAQVLPRFSLSSFPGLWEGFSLVLNWSFLLYWNQWLFTSCSLVIHYFFSISVKTYGFLLFKITSERLDNLSAFTTQEFCLFSSWESHTGKFLSSPSAPSHPPVNVLQSSERFCMLALF